MSSAIQKALEIAPGLAIVEAIFLVIWASRYWMMVRQGFQGEPFDEGPWWSVAFFRVWAACHIPVLMLQAGIHALLKKQSFPMPFLLGAFLLHAVNFALVILFFSLDKK